MGDTASPVPKSKIIQNTNSPNEACYYFTACGSIIYNSHKYKIDYHPYLDIERIKPSPDTDLCIVTLKRNEAYDYFNIKNISPLCLPANPGADWEYSNNGNDQLVKVFGFGYTKDYPELAKKRNTQQKMIERAIEYRTFTIKPMRKCFEQFGRLALKTIRNENRYGVDLTWLEM